jgi:tetratricopeptide (TPR) repeat protein
MQLTDALKEQLNDIYIEDRLTPYFALHADTYLQNGKVDFAIGILEEGLKAHSEDAVAHYLLGKAYLEKGNQSSAKAELERAVKLAPFMTNALRYLLSIAQKEKMPILVELYTERLQNIEPFVFSEEKTKIITPDKTDDIESSFEVVDEDAAEELELEKENPSVEENTTVETEIETDSDTAEEETSFIDTIETDTMIEELWQDLNSDEDEESVAVEETNVATEDTVVAEPEPDKEEQAAPSASFAKVPESAASPMVDDDLLGDELDILTSEKSTAAPKAKSAIVSPTLGEIYLAQGQFAEAKEIFVQLLANDPENPKLQRKLSDIEALLNG